jgi:hypothetical protein
MPRGLEGTRFRASLDRKKIELFRLSEKLPGEFPLRLIAAEDLNPVCLAAIGIVNSMLIQVSARQREFSVLRTIGIGSQDIARLLLIEGTLIGVVGALLAVGLGNAIGALSVEFIDHFTLFNYEFEASVPAMLAISGLAIATCALSAIYPARVAANRSSSESALTTPTARLQATQALWAAPCRRRRWSVPTPWCCTRSRRGRGLL